MVLDVPGIHAECKNVENFSINNLYAAIKQAKDDSPDEIPMIFYKKNGKSPLIVVELDTFDQFMQKWYERMYCIGDSTKT